MEQGISIIIAIVLLIIIPIGYINRRPNLLLAPNLIPESNWVGPGPGGTRDPGRVGPGWDPGLGPGRTRTRAEWDPGPGPGGTRTRALWDPDPGQEGPGPVGPGLWGPGR